MPDFGTDDLAQWTGGTWTARPGGSIGGFAIDSRRVRPGDLFVALRTDRRDGHDFLEAAAAAGATAALVAGARPGVPLAQLVVADPLAAFQRIAREHRNRFYGKVVAVSGSAGKTSTKELLAQLLGEPGEVLATEGNLNNHLGVPLTLTRLDAHRHRWAVVEAGISAPGEMARLAGMIEPDAAVITLIGPAHLEELGGLEGVAREKSALIRGVRPGGVAVFPRECESWAAFRRLPVPSIPVDFTLQPGRESVEVVLHRPGGGERFIVPSPSEGMARNAALALELARYFGVAAGPLRRRLARWRPAPGRGEIRREGGRLWYLDYYNANPASMADALRAFRRLAGGREPKLYILGGMEELGSDEARYHRELGAGLDLAPADRVLVVGPQGPLVRQGALEAGARPEQIVLADTAAEGAALAAGFTGAIFVKGSRKHQLEQAVAGRAEAAIPC
jgi:UDP-N-acetylmuramoyl-tripeptide--D-alanyl-D-alanine ligase